ncbi:MAG: hypothetical protein HY931_01910 [Candidatus Falkowbacteria bacterium]|nr:MAG: hypothetical protein HY931_01910 [Candidatus Falkowbacteria bacterium]
MKKSLKQKALRLRAKGCSFREISLALDVSKSTASVWARSVVLDTQAKLRIKKLGDDGRDNGKKTICTKQQKILAEIDSGCGVFKNRQYGIDDYKLFLALLYWGEGAKTKNRLVFINSDPAMIRVYMFLMRKSFIIKEEKFHALLHLHEYHNKEEMLNFWSKITGISKNQFSIYNKPHTGINKKEGYKGCLSIRYGDSRILKEVFLIIERCKNLPNIAGLV